MPIEIIYLGRLLAAMLAGAVVGFERELHDKPAGFRTNIMICVGAALFTILSIHLAGQRDPAADPARIAAQIVSGVGFLGAGAIIQFRGSVIGLTTAASIWAVASIGMAFGAGEILLGTTATLIVAIVLFGLSFAEERIGTWCTYAKFSLQLNADAETQAFGRELASRARKAGLISKSCAVSKSPEGYACELEVIGSLRRVEQLHDELMADPHVKSLHRT